MMMLKYLTLALAVTAVSAVREMNFDYSAQATKVRIDWKPSSCILIFLTCTPLLFFAGW